MVVVAVVMWRCDEVIVVVVVKGVVRMVILVYSAGEGCNGRPIVVGKGQGTWTIVWESNTIPIRPVVILSVIWVSFQMRTI